MPAHNQLLYPERGVIHVPQRFATDWISLGPTGRIFTEPIDRNSSYFVYDAPVLAVANGTVVSVQAALRRTDLPKLPKIISGGTSR
ncbi:MAG: hypothetical protein AVDCRST_MAG44-1341 [uncultured Sphingomonas sp.]|uniref:Uncharacterized protein n=1 Tax=uncultured Sphingomonas sp. TaxID=158754 RepID=A0A6J4T162_9SPHN|nr:MAG: hypothetical protein AVDCRST_MAG44-1341 [uncultured Sphingomonas sp.]